MNLEERYKATYGVVFEIMKKYHSKYPLPRTYSFFKEVEETIIAEYRKDKEFPLHFCQEMLNAVCAWFLHGFSGCTKDEIPDIFNSAWKFHKKYLGKTLSDEEWDAALEDANKACEQMHEQTAQYVVPIYVAILHEVERQEKKMLNDRKPDGGERVSAG